VFYQVYSEYGFVLQKCKLLRAIVLTSMTLYLPYKFNRLEFDQPQKALQIMKKIAYLFVFLIYLAGCSAENDTSSQQIAAEDINISSKDPYYQLQESEAKKHKDSAPPAN